MDNLQHNEYKTDPELEFLKYDFSNRLLSALEKNLLENGCKEPILLCGKTIIDGSKRYMICSKYGLSYKTRDMGNLSINECIAFVCRAELQRAGIPLSMGRYLVGRYYQAKAAPFLSEQLPSQGVLYAPRYTHKYSKKRIAEQLTADFHFAGVTILKYDALARHIDTIRSICPSLAMKILSDSLCIAHENVRELSRLPKEDLYYMNKIIEQEKLKRLTHSDIIHELRWRTIRSAGGPGRKRKDEPPPAIRDMPKYDPDAEISSLALTIPSWTSSIARVNEKTDFPLTTKTARLLLLEQLIRLEECINRIKESLTEDPAGEEHTIKKE